MVIDTVIALTSLVLLVMSLGSWTIIVRQALAQRGVRRGLDALGRQLRAELPSPFHSPGADGTREAPLATRGNPCDSLLEALEPGSFASGTYAQLPSTQRRDLALRDALGQLDRALGTGLGMLASIASTAPFVGLFGTVWGIFEALTAIADAGEGSIQQVAAPMGEALLMTAAGIVVALPAVIAYNRFSRERAHLAEALWNMADDLRRIDDARFSTAAATRG
ncbi:MAG: MotA/TolQ/ExbB proton channel family protein [Betaproteobacteria bacterium]